MTDTQPAITSSSVDYADLDAATVGALRRARTVAGHDDLLGAAVQEFRLPWQNIGELLIDQAAEQGDRVWLTFHDNEAPEIVNVVDYSYRDILERVTRTARLMKETLGLGTGQTIATVDLFNHADTVVLLLAAWVNGYRIAPINMEEDAQRIQFILENAQTKAAFVRASHVKEFAPIAKAAGVETFVQLGGERNAHGQDWPLYADLESATEPEFTFPNVPLDQEALLVYTSGTTGQPKGVLLTHEMLYDVDGVVQFHDFDDGDVFLTAMRLFHVNAVITSLLSSLVAGARLVLWRRWKPSDFWGTVTDEGVTTTSVVPAMLADLTRLHADLDAHPGVREQLRTVICGAGTLKKVVAQGWLDWTRIRIAHGWGMSETTCWGCWLPSDLDDAEYQQFMLNFESPSIGTPMPHNKMGIYNATGDALPALEKGQIVLAGRNVMARYFQRPDANQDTFKFGVLETGDEGFWAPDSQGRPMFFITGRLKEIIERGGEKFSPYLMDDDLSRVPGVQAALVFGFAHNRLGQEVGLVIEANQSTPPTLEEVQRFCRDAGWSWAKTPKELRCVDHIPKTSTGKDTRKAFGVHFTGCEDKHYKRPSWWTSD